MSKTIIAAAVLAACASTASAQSAVTIYGVADAGFVRESGGPAGTTNKLTSGVGAASRIGFRGTEDLGGGVSALFILENGYRIDTGAVDNLTGALFNRQALVGLKSSAGMLTLGRQYTPWHSALAQVGDPFGTGYAGTAKNLFPDSGTNVRTSNTIVYTAPATLGFTGELAYSVGEQAGDNSASRQFGASLGYSVDKLNVRLAYNNKNLDKTNATGVITTDTTIGTNKLLAANYDFGMVKAYFAYGIDKGNNGVTQASDAREVLLGLSAPVGPGKVVASATHKDDRTGANQDANAWAVGYMYALSTRTELYTAYGKIDNKNGATYTVQNNSETGTGDKAFNLGMRHSF